VRVLLADDERAIAITLADDLRRSGITVETASDGTEARSLYEGGQFDVVVTDLNMPGVTGWSCWSASSRIRTAPRSSSSPATARSTPPWTP